MTLAFSVTWGYICARYLIGSVIISSLLLLDLLGPVCAFICIPFSFPTLLFACSLRGACILVPAPPQSSCSFCARCSDPGEYVLLLVLREGRYLICRCRGKKGTLGMGYRAVFNIPVCSFPKGTITLHPVPGTINHLKRN